MSVCLSVCLFVCPVCPVLSRPPKKVTETENFAKQSCQIYFKGDKNTQSSCGAGRGEAELRTVSEHQSHTPSREKRHFLHFNHLSKEFLVQMIPHLKALI